jgi:hypothetical protein
MNRRAKQTAALCAAWVVFFAKPAYTQFSVGVEAGVANNYLVTNVSNLVSTQYNTLSGFSATVPVTYKVTDWFGLKASLGFMQKNYEYARTGFYQGVYEDFTNGYVQLPVMGQFMFGSDKIKGYANLGGFAGYWLTAHVKGRMPNILNQPAYSSTSSSTSQPNNVFDEFTAYDYSEKYQFNTTKDKRLELGVLAGLGLSYQVTDTYRVFAEASYYDGLTDLQKKYETQQVPRYNTTYVFSLGIMFNISNSGN